MTILINKSFLSTIISQNTLVQEELLSFIKNAPVLDEQMVVEFAKEHNLTVQMVTDSIYTLLHDFIAFGRSTLPQEQSIDYEQLTKGIEVEYEHTRNKLIAEKIARDHLAEFPDYYVELAKMEERLSSKKLKELEDGKSKDTSNS